jgi:ferredoxin
MAGKLKVVLVTFSNTGNTKYVADKVRDALSTEGYQVDEVDALKLVKVLDLGNQALGKIKIPDPEPEAYIDARTAIAEADVVGLGAFANCFQPSAGIAELFSEEVLPESLFVKMKFFIVYGTAGQGHGKLNDCLATLLSRKNRQAVLAGSGKFLAPENIPCLMPARPAIDVWSAGEKAKVVEFGKSVLDVLEGKAEPVATYEPGEVTHRAVFDTVAALVCGRPIVLKEKCGKCRRCAAVCPYNAISFDLEDGLPHWDLKKCRRCGRCYNFCRNDAIQFPRVHSELRAKFSAPVLIEPGEKTGDGVFVGQPQPFGFELNKRQLLGKGLEFYGPLAGLVVLLLLLLWRLV